jgi:hypothetical protein
MNLYIKLIIIQWLISPSIILPIILSKKILYQYGSFVCRISFLNTSLFIYLFIISYGIPLIFIIILHILIAHHIKKHWKFHQERRLSGIYIICPMQRILIIIFVLVISALPCEIFFIREYLHLSIVPYAHKVVLIFVSLSITLTMILIFGLNRSIRNSCLLLFHRTDRQMIKLIVYKSARKLPE